MNRRYLCPHCGAHLNPGPSIVLRAERQGQRGLVLLSPQPGDYDVVLAEGLQLRARDVVELSCPVCGHDLRSPRNAALAELSFATDAATGTVAFSRTYGEHATWLVTHDQVEHFGEHASDLNFWGSGRGR